jgi:DNA-binding transcriptional ArsR family regulator
MTTRHGHEMRPRSNLGRPAHQNLPGIHACNAVPSGFRHTGVRFRRVSSPIRTRRDTLLRELSSVGREFQNERSSFSQCATNRHTSLDLPATTSEQPRLSREVPARVRELPSPQPGAFTLLSLRRVRRLRILNLMVQYSQARLDASFAALSDATRRGVLEQLGRGEASLSELAERFHMTLTGMKKHIGVLEHAGLVSTEKVGRVRTCRRRPGLQRITSSGRRASKGWTT